jgi:MerR family transcriptional regulator, light-induced transcriptional regulator
MSKFSIKDLEQLSGIKAHTIRIWEQRYDLVQPERSDTNIRSYDDDALKLILNVAMLNNHGYKISKIAKMSAHEMQQEVLAITEERTNADDQIQALTIAMVDMDEERFEKILSSNAIKIGFEQTMLKIIHPFLIRIGILWQTGSINPAQEHFITNLIRQKLIVAIDSKYVTPNAKTKKYILFLPEGELHELSLLFADLIVKSRNNRSIYLGQSLPIQDLQSAYQTYQPDYILSIITSTPGSSDIQAYVNKLSSLFPKCTILLSGYQVMSQDIQTPHNIKIFNNPEDLMAIASQA